MKNPISNVVLAVALCALSAVSISRELTLKNIDVHFESTPGSFQNWFIPYLIVDDKNQTVLNLNHQLLMIPRSYKDGEILSTEDGYEWQHDFNLRIKDGKLILSNESWQLISQNVSVQSNIEHISDVFEYRSGEGMCETSPCNWKDTSNGQWTVTYDVK